MFIPISIVLAAALLGVGVTRAVLLMQDRRAFRLHRNHR